MSAGTQTERFATLFLCDSDIGRGLEDDGEADDGTQLLADCRSSLPCWPCVWFRPQTSKNNGASIDFRRGFSRRRWEGLETNSAVARDLFAGSAPSDSPPAK